MKFVLMMILFTSTATAMACPINLKFVKNQTSFSIQDFNKFLKKLTLNHYVIRDRDYQYEIAVRLTKRSLYDDPEKKLAMVSIDVYDSQKKLLSTSMASGSPSQIGLAAFSVLQYESALTQIIKELPRCL
ncbi:MAG: hypothetical protein ACJ76H_01125 [Bacteriovoracaceae bacterium]